MNVYEYDPDNMVLESASCTDNVQRWGGLSQVKDVDILEYPVVHWIRPCKFLSN